MGFIIESRTRVSDTWRRVHKDHSRLYDGGDPRREFVASALAKECATAFSLFWPQYEVRVKGKHSGRVYWASQKAPNQPIAGGETTVATPDLNKPLTIARPALIEKLDENLAAEVAKREAAEAERAEERKAVIDAIKKFSDDELYNIFESNFTVEVDTLKFDKKNKSYVTQAIKPSKTESDLEKFARVLKMANDETVELIPNQVLYDLL